MNEPADRSQRSLARLLEIMRRLRDPQGGCPWDREQDFASIAPYTIEEAYEVADAIARGAPKDIESELGDLLFQVVFHAQMGGERGWFDFASVADAISDKLTARHPHVFGDARSARSANRTAPGKNTRRANARRAIGAGAQRACRRAAGTAGPGARRQAGQTCRARGFRLAGRAGRARQDRRGAAGSRCERPPSSAPESSATCCLRSPNWSRHFGVDAEEALRQANAKFERRFRAMEHLARQRALQLAQPRCRDLGRVVERGQEERKNQRIQRSVGIHRPLRRLPPRSRCGRWRLYVEQTRKFWWVSWPPRSPWRAPERLPRTDMTMIATTMVATTTVVTMIALTKMATAPTTTPRWSTSSR